MPKQKNTTTTSCAFNTPPRPPAVIMHTCHNTDTLKRFELSLDPSPTKSTNQCEERHQSGWLLRSRLTNTEQKWCFLCRSHDCHHDVERHHRLLQQCELWIRINSGFAPLRPVCVCLIVLFCWPIEKKIQTPQTLWAPCRVWAKWNSNICQHIELLTESCMYLWLAWMQFHFWVIVVPLHLAHLQPLLTCCQHKMSTTCCNLVNHS